MSLSATQKQSNQSLNHESVTLKGDRAEFLVALQNEDVANMAPQDKFSSALKRSLNHIDDMLIKDFSDLSNNIPLLAGGLAVLGAAQLHPVSAAVVNGSLIALGAGAAASQIVDAIKATLSASNDKQLEEAAIKWARAETTLLESGGAALLTKVSRGLSALAVSSSDEIIYASMLNGLANSQLPNKNQMIVKMGRLREEGHSANKILEIMTK